MVNKKVFGIGFHKTGTTTLGKCFEILGYNYMGCRRDLLEDLISRNDYNKVFDVVKKYDAFEDWPWPLIYKELDREFPGSKFILTIRKDEETWLNSIKKHSLKRLPIFRINGRKLIYGHTFPHRHEKVYLDYYNRHNRGVSEYFKDRPDDLLVVCWESGAGWEALCSFLNKEIPKVNIPHANKSRRAKSIKSKFIFLINSVLSRF